MFLLSKFFFKFYVSIKYVSIKSHLTFISFFLSSAVLVHAILPQFIHECANDKHIIERYFLLKCRLLSKRILIYFEILISTNLI